MAVSLQANVIESATFPTAATFQANGLANPINVALAAGISVGPPATYAGFSHAQTSGPSGWQRYQITYGAGYGNAQGEFWWDLTPFLSPGDEVWLGLFGYSGAIPSPGDVPLAVAGPFVVGP